MRRLTPLSVALDGINTSLKKGRVSVEAKLKEVYKKNAGNKVFDDGITDYKARLSARSGSSMAISNEDAFVKMVQSRLSDPEHPAKGELQGAIRRATASDILVNERKLSSTLKSWEDLIGRQENSGRWKKFKRETGYTGSADDFGYDINPKTGMPFTDPVTKKPLYRMTRRSGQEIEYKGPDGKRWLLQKFYDKTLGGMVADWTKL